MDNEVEGVQIGIYSYEIFGKPIFRFGVQVGAFLFSIVDVNIAFCRKKLMSLLKIYVTLIQLIVLNIESNCNLASNRTT